jgi:hypothetical protein
MAIDWLGPARYLFIPVVVSNTPGWDDPPDDYRGFVDRRVHGDPDPETGEDRSLASYIASVSYGRAHLDATVSRPIDLGRIGTGDNPTLLAIQAHPDSHKFEYLAVVYPPNRVGAGGGMAQPGRIDFDPPRSPNRTKARCRFRHDAAIGTWAMEVMHNVTEIGDYYNGVNHPGNFDLMAGAGGTHPSAYTKLKAGWLDRELVANHPGGTRRYILRAIGAGRPRSGEVAAVRIQAEGSNRYLMIEARTRRDRWDRGFSDASRGIPSEGVVVYEFAADWPRLESNPNGPKPPLQLRTPTALAIGATFSHQDPSTPDSSVRDHRSGLGRYRSLRVRSATADSFEIEVTSDRALPPTRPPRDSDPRPPRPGDDRPHRQEP